jgi:DNA-binding response OmpR family regulator
MIEPCKVLIVEDEPLIAESLIDLLQTTEHHVVGAATSAEQAFTLAERSAPEVAVLDVKLSGDIDGVSLATELARRYGTSVVFITGNPQTVFDRGWDFRHSVLAKPFNDCEFLEAIAAACAAYRGTGDGAKS